MKIFFLLLFLGCEGTLFKVLDTELDNVSNTHFKHCDLENRNLIAQQPANNQGLFSCIMDTN